jgi:hypothetical protein
VVGILEAALGKKCREGLEGEEAKRQATKMNGTNGDDGTSEWDTCIAICMASSVFDDF